MQLTKARTPGTPNTTEADKSSKEVSVAAPPSSKTSNTVVIDKHLRIGPFQTKVVQVNIIGMSVSDRSVGIVTPSETLANLQCNFTEEIWICSTPRMLAVTNWGGEPLVVEQGTTMGSIEEVELISQDDPVWSDTDPLPVDVARLDESTASQRKVKLETQAVIGGGCSEKQCGRFKQLLLSKHDVFTLSDSKLGKTNLVEHVIDTGEAKPVRTDAYLML